MSDLRVGLKENSVSNVLLQKRRLFRFIKRRKRNSIYFVTVRLVELLYENSSNSVSKRQGLSQKAASIASPFLLFFSKEIKNPLKSIDSKVCISARFIRCS